MISINENGPGRVPPAVPGKTFPENMRRLIAGETTIEGDMIYKPDENGEWLWRPAKVGHTVAYLDDWSHATAKARSIEPIVAARAMATFASVINGSGYLIENMVTAEMTAGRCHRCHAEGTTNGQMLFDMLSSLDLTPIEEEMIEEAELMKGDPNGDYVVDAYERLKYKRIEEGRPPLPDLPKQYEHEPDCEAAWLRNLLHSFEDVFYNYVDKATPYDYHEMVAHELSSEEDDDVVDD